MAHEHLCMGCMAEKGRAEICPKCGWREGTMPQSPFHLPPRTLLAGRYLLGRVLGQGGFAITYLAWDTYLKIKVAIKEHFPSQYISRNMGQATVSAYSGEGQENFQYSLDKFLEEARALGQFDDHPNIVSVRDIFNENSTAYMVMNFVDGMTLKQYLDQNGGKLPFDLTLKIMTPVMDAIKEVHAAGMLHRDISPDNIYLTRTGQVKLLDFGAARHAIGEYSKSLSMILKPGYAPWEQYQEKGRQGPWTDVYALGATIYRALTGKVLPQATDRLEEDLVGPPSALGVAIPAPAEKALMKAIAVKAANRYQTVEDLQQEFNAGYVNINCPHCGSLNQLGMDTQPEQASCIVCHKPLKPADNLINCPHCGATNQVPGNLPVAQAVCRNCQKTLAAPKPAGMALPRGKLAAIAAVVIIAAASVLFVVQNTGEKAIALANGGFYVGQTWFGKPDGQGKATFADGRKYEGQFKNGAMNGAGTLIYPDQSKYSGEFVNDLRHGKGKFVNAKGETTYDGEWRDGEKNGKGTAVLESGSTYTGDFKNGKMTGKGKFTLRNGDEYEGDVVDGKFHGEGVYKAKNGGWEYRGSFRDDKRHGKGGMKWNDGKVYTGEFANGVISGKGKMVWADGKVDEGEWGNGRFLQ